MQYAISFNSLIEPEEKKEPSSTNRQESEEERKRREDRLKAMESRMTQKSKIDDRGVQQTKASQYNSSGGRNERVLEDRARALLSKKTNFEDTIKNKEEEEYKKQELAKIAQDELAMQRTDSQKERANKVSPNWLFLGSKSVWRPKQTSRVLSVYHI